MAMRKAKVLRCRHRHALREWGWHIPGGGVDFDPYLVDEQQGGGIYGRGWG